MANAPMHALDNLVDLRAFAQVVQAGGFTAASRRLGMSRSAVGKCVARLEAGLGARLLHRTTRQVALTDEGRVLHDHAVRILAEVDEAQAALDWRSAAPRGQLRLDVPVTLGRLHILPILQRYLARWPALHVDVTFSDAYSDLVGDGIDLAIRVGGDTDSRLIRKMLAPHWLVTCASPGYLAARGTPRSLDDLAGHDAALFVHAGSPAPWRFAVDGTPVSLPIQGRWRVNHPEALRDIALAGGGLVQIAAFLVGEDLQAGRLVPVLQDFVAPGAPVCAVYPSRRHLTPKVRQLLDMIEACWQGGPPWARVRRHGG